MTIGFDPAQGMFLGSVVASVMSHRRLHRGTLDGDTPALGTEGPGFGGDLRARCRDLIALQSDDARTLTSRMQIPFGSRQQVMPARYRHIG